MKFEQIKHKLQDIIESFINENDIDCEVDWDDESITITKQSKQILVIFKKDLEQIWYSSPISGATRFPVEFGKKEDKITYTIKPSTSNLIFEDTIYDEIKNM